MISRFSILDILKGMVLMHLIAFMHVERQLYVLKSFPNVDLLDAYDTNILLQESDTTYRDTRGTMPLNEATLARVASTMTTFNILRDWSSKGQMITNVFVAHSEYVNCTFHVTCK